VPREGKPPAPSTKQAEQTAQDPYLPRPTKERSPRPIRGGREGGGGPAPGYTAPHAEGEGRSRNSPGAARKGEKPETIILGKRPGTMPTNQN